MTLDPKHRQRLITGGMLGGILLILMLWAFRSCQGCSVLSGALLLAVALASFEFSQFCAGWKQPARALLYLVLTLGGPAASYFLLLGRGCFALTEPGETAAYLIRVPLLCLLAAPFLVSLFARNRLETARDIFADLWPGLMLISLGGTAWTTLPLVYGPAWFLYSTLVVAANDVGAYYAGSRIGGPKIVPAISPGKTVSGTCGGLIAGCLAGFGAVLTMRLPLAVPEVMLLSLLVGAASQSGDWLKSFLKRVHGVKDSGAILPGHGGVLDRIDGHLFAAAGLFVFLVLAG